MDRSHACQLGVMRFTGSHPGTVVPIARHDPRTADRAWLRTQDPKAEPATGPQDTRYEDADENIPDLCRAALSVMDNDSDREDWIKVCYAIRDAGLGYQDWVDWCAKWHGVH
jgi:hypothetical protein